MKARCDAVQAMVGQADRFRSQQPGASANLTDKNRDMAKLVTLSP